MKTRIRQWPVKGLRLRGFQRARLSVFVIVPILVGCNDTTGPTRFVSITPASQSVALENAPTGKILRTSVTMTNTSSFPITWDYCGLTLEKKIEGPILLAVDGPSPPWFTVWAQPCYAFATGSEAVAVFTTPLQPGKSVTIPINVPVTLTGSLHFDGSPGDYRVHLTLATQILKNQYRVIPHDLSVSDPFTVTAQ